MSCVPEYPRLKPWYRVALVEDGLAVEYGESVLCFGGRAATELLPLLFPLLDGTRSVAELERALGEPIRPAIENAIERLAELGVLVDGVMDEAPALLARTAAFCAAGSDRGLDESSATEALRQTTIAIAGAGPLAAELLRLLRLCGLGSVSARDWDEKIENGVALAVAAPEASELAELSVWNAACLDTATTWLQLLPFNGRFAVVGPLFVPGETACYECYRLRRAANVGYSEEFWPLEQATARRGSTPALDALVAGAAASLILRWALAHDAQLPGRLFAVGFDDGIDIVAHEVFRVPRCPACSGLAEHAGPLPWADAA